MAGEKGRVDVKVERWRLVKKDAATGRVEEVIEGGDDRPTVRRLFTEESEGNYASDR